MKRLYAARKQLFKVIQLPCLLITAIWSVSSVQAQTLELLQGIQSASGVFEQIIREQDGYLVDRQSGTFVIDRPRRLRWEINELDQLLVSDGSQLYFYDQLFQQVVVRDWSSNPALNPAAILLDQVDLEDWAEVERVGNNYKLVPLKNFGSIQELNLTFSDEFPELLSLLDVTGQITEIHFSQVVLNKTNEDTLFVFVMPEGVEVLYE
ncbi:MAG: outer membrane lipoprotein chaperone LolA [Porticoccaceae bacterium]|jgi:outer membrane lipoprotein carrier protein|nr:outer membrane lipoprotein chaperone LolA [Porticoccaceae bacterium]